MRIKLLSDFDGVWTDQALEAENVKLYLVAEAARMAGIAADRARADFTAFERTILAEPARFGWAPDGRITAYVDEDPFCLPNSIANYLATATQDARAAPYRQGILEHGFADMNAFADACFFGAMRTFREQHPPALLPHATRVIEALQARGVQMTIVSNSPAERIITWFRQVGVDAGEDGRGTVRVRGQAGKQTIAASEPRIVVAGRPIFVDRPRYRAVIAEERPDLVIGNVFSLDLALPHVLRDAGMPQAPRLLVLRRHPHTPPWVLALAEDGPIDRIVDDPEALLDIVEEFAA